jgi:D-amino-acid dehydrogenase
VSDLETLLGDASASDLFVKRDSLRVFDTEAQFLAEAPEREVKRVHGYEMKKLSGDECHEIEPALSPHIACGTFHGGWYFVTNPEKVVKSLAANVAGNGGTILRDDVIKIECEDGVAKRLRLKSREPLAIDKLIICAGAYSHLLSAQLGEKVPLEAERGYHLVLPDPGISLTRTITYARTPGGATPMEMGLRLAGTDEFAGLDAPPNWGRADKLWHVFKKVLPDMRTPDEKAARWMGRRPGTPDSLPVIGRSKNATNVFYGFGHGHMGLTWGPTTGRLLAELMGGAKSNIDLQPFRVDRF